MIKFILHHFHFLLELFLYWLCVDYHAKERVTQVWRWRWRWVPHMTQVWDPLLLLFPLHFSLPPVYMIYGLTDTSDPMNSLTCSEFPALWIFCLLGGTESCVVHVGEADMFLREQRACILYDTPQSDPLIRNVDIENDHNTKRWWQRRWGPYW